MPESKEKSVELSADARLLNAVAEDNHADFAQALKDKANPNFGSGAPLCRAAFQNNPLMMRWLMTAGADVDYAVKNLKERRGEIKRSQTYDDYIDEYHYRYKSKEDEQRYKTLTTAIKTLEQFDKKYKNELAPLEIIRLQKETLAEIQALKEEMTTAIHGRSLDKKPLPAPKEKPKETKGLSL